MGTGTATPTVGMFRATGRCGIRLTTPNVAGRSFGIRVSRRGGLIVDVRGGARDGRRGGGSRGGRNHCLHHRFSCAGFRRAVVLPSSISGRGVNTRMRGNILGVALPGFARTRGRGTGGFVSMGWHPTVGGGVSHYAEWYGKEFFVSVTVQGCFFFPFEGQSIDRLHANSSCDFGRTWTEAATPAGMDVVWKVPSTVMTLLLRARTMWICADKW